MKLEVGKSYVNRLWEVVRIIAREPDSKSIYEYWDGDQWYMENGQWSNTTLEYPQDLIAEAPEVTWTDYQIIPPGEQIATPDHGGLASAKSLREWYAGHALTGICANPHAWEELTHDSMIALAWIHADAMIKASKK